MKLRWVAVHHSSPTSFNMALPKLPKLGAMRGKMLKAKASPSIKLTDMKTTTGPKRPMTRNIVGSPITRGEMI